MPTEEVIDDDDETYVKSADLRTDLHNGVITTPMSSMALKKRGHKPDLRQLSPSQNKHKTQSGAGRSQTSSASATIKNNVADLFDLLQFFFLGKQNKVVTM